MTKHPRYNLLPELKMNYASLTFNSKCNGNCINCCGQIINQEDMPLEKIKEILYVVIQGMRVKKIYPSCLAEMTLIPYVNDIVKYINDIRIPNLMVSQDTNARFIPEGFIEVVNNCDFSYHISISLWGYNKESWEENQGVGSYEKTLSNIETYLKELKNPPTFSFPYITEEQYSKTLKFIKDLCGKYGYKTEVLKENDNRVLAIEKIKDEGNIPIYIRRYSVHIEDYTDVYTKGIKMDFIPFNNCDNLFQGISIDSLGYIYPCTGMYRKEEHILGNVNDYSPFTYKDFLTIIHSEKAINYIKKNFSLNGEFACSLCEKCSTRICN